MIRTVFEFLIQRYHDQARPWPMWLRWLIQRDLELGRFANDSQRLDALLRTGAQSRREWCSTLQVQTQHARNVIDSVVATRSRQRPRDRVRPLGWLITPAIAASLILALLLVRLHDRGTDAQRVRFLSDQFAAVPDEMLGLIQRAAHASQSHVVRYSPWSQVSLPRTNLWQNVAVQTQQRVQESAGNLFSPWMSLGDDLRARWEASQSTTSAAEAGGT